MKLKIKKTDSLDGTTVLEALSKYKELEPQDKKMPLQRFSTAESTLNYFPTLNPPFEFSIKPPINFTDNQFSTAADQFEKKYRSKTNS